MSRLVQPVGLIIAIYDAISEIYVEIIKGFLLDHGIEIDDDADLVLSENYGLREKTSI